MDQLGRLDVLRRARGDAVLSQNGEGKPTVTSEILIRVIDDDANVRRALRRLIESTGRRVREFGSAEEFLESPRDDSPGCLVLDLQLPEMSGFELRARLATMTALPPVVFITAFDTPEARAQASAAGAAAFLTKPFSGQTLLETVRRVLG